ncbi:hypothetical protein DEV91_102218 [Phyllobacterium brassicacearum]|nr:hypothetical protein DEV91_102218 [Phyllobacterium brassicacearum]
MSPHNAVVLGPMQLRCVEIQIVGEPKMALNENRNAVNFHVHEHRIAEKRHLQATMA